MNFFKLGRLDLWGDYGSILINGMTAHLPEKEGKLQLERTGPFVPPITFPGVGDVLVTDGFRKKLQKAEFSGLEFREVLKTRIVKLEWEKWDRKADRPKILPAGGEPEDYILNRKHSAEVADDIGIIWQVILPEGAKVEAVNGGKPWEYDLCVHEGTWNGNNIFWGKKGKEDSGTWVIVSDLGKRWMEDQAGEWVRFTPCLRK